jgi:hypothetical protein
MVEGRLHAHVTVACGVTGDWLWPETPQPVGAIPPPQQLQSQPQQLNSSNRIHPSPGTVECSCLIATASR